MIQQIGPLANWHEMRTKSGEFWHPEFWSAALDIPKDEEAYLKWYVDRVIELNLETLPAWLEDEEGKDIFLAELDPSKVDGYSGGFLPGTSWFILSVNDSDDGPFITWARVRTEEPAV